MLHEISRRKFSYGLMAAGGMLLISRRARAAEFELRQFHNQPADSPLHKRLVEMWDAVKTETNGRVQVQTFPENNQIAGGDPAALNMVVSGELDFFTLNGGSIGNIVPAVNVQGILFAFRTPAQVFDALDGDLGDYLRQEMKAKGLYALPKGCFDNGFHQITCSTRPIRSVDDLQGLKIRTPDAPIYVEAW
jgi:TRAP-type transport system periplasmic protein